MTPVKSHRYQEETMISGLQIRKPSIREATWFASGYKASTAAAAGTLHIAPTTYISASLIFYEEVEIYKVKELSTKTTL